MDDPQVEQVPPPKFRHRYWVHLIWFLLTLGMTTWAGWAQYIGFRVSIGAADLNDLSSFRWYLGLIYSAPILLILGAHEFGHYYYCRKHQVDASLPYFLPTPLPLFTGTFGAVIRIRQAFPSVRSLFDIGIAGPIAGFVVLLPFLYWGVTLSGVVKMPASADVIYFGEPLLFKAVARWHFGVLPPGFDIVLHPMGFAAWFGMLATAMNLLPFGQLDGGHIAYAVFGPRARYLSMATLIVIGLLMIWSFSWISMALIMLAMAFFLGFRHPPIVDEGTPLDPRRRMVALVALAIFVLCFTPVPIQTFFGR